MSTSLSKAFPDWEVVIIDSVGGKTRGTLNKDDQSWYFMYKDDYDIVAMLKEKINNENI